VRFAVPRVRCRGEPGADLAGLGGAKLGVKGQGLLPVAASLAVIARGL